MNYLLECRDVSYKTGAGDLLKKVDFTLLPGQEAVITSDSQETASCLLQICSTLLRPTGGKLLIAEKEVDFDDYEELLNLKKKLAFVDRNSSLMQNLSVLENIALAGRYHENKSLEEIHIKTDPIIEMLGLGGVLNLRPAELIYATRRRVLYAIEMLKEPLVAIFDQPESDYHQNDRKYLHALFDTLKKESNCGLIVATRSKSLAKEVGNTMIVMRDGTVET